MSQTRIPSIEPRELQRQLLEGQLRVAEQLDYKVTSEPIIFTNDDVPNYLRMLSEWEEQGRIYQEQLRRKGREPRARAA